ncbi:MAG: hypothetical protein KJZ91_00555 [Myxococcales bacterium]|nr:hypothetical protein [Myxococcales bacterium]
MSRPGDADRPSRPSRGSGGAVAGLAASHRARALALAAHHAGASGDAALARIGGDDGAAARAWLALLRGPTGAALLAATRAELAAPRPARWRDIHPSWIDAALAPERPAVRAAATGPLDTPLARYCARAFLGGLVPMPPPSPPSAGAPGLLALDAAHLVAALAVLGRRQLVHALGDGGARALGGLVASVPWGAELLAERAAVAALAGADAHLGSRKSALARTAGLRWTEPLAPTRAGLRAIAPAVARHPDLDAQLAQRLTRPVGVVARVELAAFVEPGDGASVHEIAAAIGRATVAP